MPHNAYELKLRKKCNLKIVFWWLHDYRLKSMFFEIFSSFQVPFALWGFLHLKSALIRNGETQKTEEKHGKRVKFNSIFEGEITKKLKK